ncbi:hypothetical protein C8A06_1120 [Microbacteriaceae bacterium MWH-Ta3]|nr:hypothetical protein C8A06_1120 [Microbacteriaceae bacterium MWH-Ta3]
MNHFLHTGPFPAYRRQIGDDRERGDVPGWVLITLMTAGLVVVIWAMAGPALSGVFTDAIERVTNF